MPIDTASRTATNTDWCGPLLFFFQKEFSFSQVCSIEKALHKTENSPPVLTNYPQSAIISSLNHNSYKSTSERSNRMENVKEIIARNLTELRKSHKMTQSALAEKLNYSDKAISRWEHAETLPDIETLCRICDIYGVKFEYLLQREPSEALYTPAKKGDTARRVVMCLIAVTTVWLLATVLFMSVSILGEYQWMLFIWAIPLSSITVSVCNKIWWKRRVCTAISSSLTLWTLILALYLQTVQYNIWLLFVVGAPIQAIILLAATITEKKTR